LFDIGASLTAARESQGLVLADAERLTRLRERYLRALEEDRFDVLPGRAYARAFLRSYADALSLDADRFVAEFDQRFPQPDEDSTRPVFGTRPARRAARHNRLRWPRS
jgi:cytoskeletal protein RodZ